MSEPTVQEQIDSVEISIAAAKEKVQMADSVMRLMRNRDFKRVIFDHFMRDDVARCVKALADPSCQDARTQADLLKGIHAVGQFDQFLRMTVLMGNMAEKAMQDDEAMRQELLDTEEA